MIDPPQCQVLVVYKISAHLGIGSQIAIIIEVDDRPVEALIDTGAGVSIISYKVLDNNSWDDSKLPFRLVTANDQPLHILGTKIVKIKLGKFTFHHKVIVSKDIPDNLFIMGNDINYEYGMKIDYNRELLSLNSSGEIPWFHKHPNSSVSCSYSHVHKRSNAIALLAGCDRGLPIASDSSSYHREAHSIPNKDNRSLDPENLSDTTMASLYDRQDGPPKVSMAMIRGPASNASLDITESMDHPRLDSKNLNTPSNVNMLTHNSNPTNAKPSMNESVKDFHVHSVNENASVVNKCKYNNHKIPQLDNSQTLVSQTLDSQNINNIILDKHTNILNKKSAFVNNSLSIQNTSTQSLGQNSLDDSQVSLQVNCDTSCCSNTSPFPNSDVIDLDDSGLDFDYEEYDEGTFIDLENLPPFDLDSVWDSYNPLYEAMQVTFNSSLVHSGEVHENLVLTEDNALLMKHSYQAIRIKQRVLKPGFLYAFKCSITLQEKGIFIFPVLLVNEFPYVWVLNNTNFTVLIMNNTYIGRVVPICKMTKTVSNFHGENHFHYSEGDVELDQEQFENLAYVCNIKIVGVTEDGDSKVGAEATKEHPVDPNFKLLDIKNIGIILPSAMQS